VTIAACLCKPLPLQSCQIIVDGCCRCQCWLGTHEEYVVFLVLVAAACCCYRPDECFGLLPAALIVVVSTVMLSQQLLHALSADAKVLLKQKAVIPHTTAAAMVTV
jgi:hypothetical protein